MVGVPCVLSLSSISPGLVVTTGHRLSLQQSVQGHEGVPCPSLGSGAGDLHEPMLPSPVSSPFLFLAFGHRPVTPVSLSFCSMLIPTQVSWGKRCSAHERNTHFLWVLPPVMNFSFALVTVIVDTVSQVPISYKFSRWGEGFLNVMKESNISEVWEASRIRLPPTSGWQRLIAIQALF